MFDGPNAAGSEDEDVIFRVRAAADVKATMPGRAAGSGAGAPGMRTRSSLHLDLGSNLGIVAWRDWWHS